MPLNPHSNHRHQHLLTSLLFLLTTTILTLSPPAHASPFSDNTTSLLDARQTGCIPAAESCDGGKTCCTGLFCSLTAPHVRLNLLPLSLLPARNASAAPDSAVESPAATAYFAGCPPLPAARVSQPAAPDAWITPAASAAFADRMFEKSSSSPVETPASATQQPNSEWLELDLADPRSARRAAEEFLGKEGRLDVLVNNAALVSGPFKLDADGLLDIMVINHISHFVLTEALLPLMKQTAATSPDSDVRIVAVTSNALAFVQPESFATRETLNKQFGESALGMVKTYGAFTFPPLALLNRDSDEKLNFDPGYTKLANILHMKALQRRLDSENPNNNITCIAVHPGTTKTPATEGFMGANLPLIGGFIGTVIMPLIFAKPSKGGMAVAVPAAGAMKGKGAMEEWKGAYFTPKGIETPSASALDVRLQDELWETTRSVVNELGL
ncbi:hypothetical protein R3P38DRAFT_3290509 [Favolaschia claudopus]|uniref:Uncharacterized protein n=1 Tax=Favolaschia claudopus TaxID=2862362 RepID=A0AAV9ZTI5_9AGAR